MVLRIPGWGKCTMWHDKIHILTQAQSAFYFICISLICTITHPVKYLKFPFPGQNENLIHYLQFIIIIIIVAHHHQ